MPRLRISIAIALSLGVTSCVATVRPDPVYAEATYVPADIETYPYVIYDGRPVYYVHDHWYFRSGPSWVYYRSEPPVLYRQRPYARQAPPAPRPSAPRPGYTAPPARRVE